MTGADLSTGRHSEVNRGLQRHRRSLREAAHVLVAAVILAIFVRTWLAQAFVVPSTSMSPTLVPGDHLLVNKFIVRAKPVTRLLPARPVRRGDVLVTRDPRNTAGLLVKRCVALPGDSVALVDKVLVVNGIPRREVYTTYHDERVYPASSYLEDSLRHRDNFGPEVLAADEFFCLGDARDISLDSRHWGAVHRSAILGRAALVYHSRPSTTDSSASASEDARSDIPETVGSSTANPLPTPRWIR